MTRWLMSFPADNEGHVTPVNDLMEHSGQDCACGPQLRPVEQVSGGMAWLYVHNSLDGRELTEPDHRAVP